MTSSPTNSKEGNKRHFDFNQSMATKFVPGEYPGKMPDLAPASGAAAANETE